MNKRQKILKVMIETARAETAKGTDLRDVREAVRQTRDNAIAAMRQGITLHGEQDTEHDKENDSMTDIPMSTMTIGTKAVLLDESDYDEFVRGYDDGYETCHRHRRDNTTIYASTLLFYVRNGWNDTRSDMYNTKFQVGWLAAFLEQEEGQLARCVDINSPGGGGADKQDIQSV